MKIAVYEFHDPIDFLTAYMATVQTRNPRFSLRSWAKQLGLSNVAMLSMVMNRKRRLLPSLSSKISQFLLKNSVMSEMEARYFDVLVLFSNASTLDEKHFYEGILSSLRPDRQFSPINLDQMRVISEWYHVAILEMTELKDFKSDPRWISLCLGDSVNEAQVKEAIDRLIRVGLLKRSATGELERIAAQIATSTDISSEAIRSFHSQMIQKAHASIEKQAIDARDISAHMMVIKKEKLPEAKRMIRDFRRKLANFLETPGGDAVYQVNIQLFNVLEGNLYDQK